MQGQAAGIRPLFVEVIRGIEVRPGMHAHGDRGDIACAPVSDPHGPAAPELLIARPHRHAAGYRL